MKLNIKKTFYSTFQKKINFNIFKKFFFILSLSYFFIYFFKNLDQVSLNISFEKNSNNLFLSFSFCILSIFFNALAWKNIVLWFGRYDTKKNLVSFYVLTNILKYVPGGIWHFVERFNFIKDRSNPYLAFYSTLIEPYFMICASFLLATIGIIYSPIYLFLVIPSIFLNKKLITLVLQKLELLKGKAIKKLKLQNSDFILEQKIKLTSFFPFKAFLFEIGFILSKFVGFFICINIVSSVNNNQILFLLIVFCLSWSIGLIVPAAPSGIGVFEACFLFLVGKNIPHNLIIVSLIYFRLISSSADIFLSLPFLLKKFLRKI